MSKERYGSIEYELVRSKRRTIGITIKPDVSVVVRAPIREPKHSIESVVAEKAEWIERKLDLMRERKNAAAKHTFADGDIFYLSGEPYILMHSGVKRVSAKDGVLHVPSCDSVETRKLIEAWYKREAKERFKVRMGELSSLAKLPFGKLSLSSAKTRWGSCNARGDIRISWKLVMAPQAVLDYVMLHELCHTKELNHSAAFWRLVEGFMPDHKRARAWLRENHSMLEL